MPLVKSRSKAAVAANIRREIAAGVPQKQAVAIALETRRRADGGQEKPPGDKPVRNGDKVRKSVPQRDGLRKRLLDRMARGGAL